MSVAQAKRKISSSSEVPPSKKRIVTVQTVEKKKLEYVKAIETASWLQYDKAADRQHVSALRCTVCTKFADCIRNCRNFNPAFIRPVRTWARLNPYWSHTSIGVRDRSKNLDRSTTIASALLFYLEIRASRSQIIHVLTCLFRFYSCYFWKRTGTIVG